MKIEITITDLFITLIISLLIIILIGFQCYLIGKTKGEMENIEDNTVVIYRK